jgi:hypothetical protein
MRDARKVFSVSGKQPVMQTRGWGARPKAEESFEKKTHNP